jgi:hypothetical protein
MREVTETFKVYKFLEPDTPEEVNEKIKDQFRLSPYFGWWIIDDRLKTLKAFAKYLESDLDYSISLVPDRGEFIKLKNGQWQGYLNEKVHKEINDNHFLDLVYDFINNSQDCPLTGFCCDEELRESLKKYRNEINMMQRVFNDFLDSTHQEYEALFEDDNLKEYCDMNDFEFKEDGTLYI